MPLKLVDLIRRYVFRFVLFPAATVTIAGTIIGASLAVWLERGVETKLLAANAKNFEQLILSGDSIGLDRQLRAISTSRQWTAAYVLNPQSRVIASYPAADSVGTTGSTLRCVHSQEFVSSWNAVVGRLCWETQRFRTAIPTIAAFICVMGVIIWIQASLGVFLGRLISLHTRSLAELAELFGRSRPITPEDIPGMPQETLEAAQLLDAVRRFISIEKKLKAAEIESEKQRALSAIAEQVAHDVRSPLAALDSALRDSPEFPEDRRRLVVDSVDRIRAIANDLLQRNRSPDATSVQGVEPGRLWDMIEPLLNEKRLQFHGATFEIRGICVADQVVLCRVPGVEFKRVLSNLINNAVESLKNVPGTVTVCLEVQGDRARVSVKDDGVGISPEILAKLGERGMTHGKSGGSGLGLHHAKSCAQAWGGGLEIESKVGLGTTVTLVLPVLLAASDIVLIDDDPLVRRTWEMAARRSGRTVRSFATVDAFLGACGTINSGASVYVDSHLEDGVRGEDEVRRIHQAGFQEIYLATGYEAAKFSTVAHLRGVVGKDPPWGEVS